VLDDLPVQPLATREQDFVVSEIFAEHRFGQRLGEADRSASADAASTTLAGLVEDLA
jgi:hypothetical protein